MDKLNAKKVISMLTIMSIVLAMATCFAASGEQDFVDALTDPTTGISADTMWGAVIPVTKIIVFVFTFAFAYRIIKRVLKKGSTGKFGM